MKKNISFCLVFLALLVFSTEGHARRRIKINQRGYWEGASIEHKFDAKLSKAIVNFLSQEKPNRVADFGCGDGHYVREIIKAGIECHGYDGNPEVVALTKGLGALRDLSKPFNLGFTYDWVVSLEVGEHIPKQYESIFLENIKRHSKKGVVLSWALKGQRGTGHVNTQNNDYIKKRMASLGFVNDVAAENKLRRESTFHYFKNTVMVFRKK